jgi:hypothetical protein
MQEENAFILLYNAACIEEALPIKARVGFA